jgi:hypothetical protein
MQMNARFAAAMARALAEETQTEPPAQGTQHPRLGSLGNEGLGRLSQGPRSCVNLAARAPDPQAAEAAAVGAFNLSENRPERG